MIVENVSLADFTPAHIELLDRWLRRHHVKRWYPDPNSYIEWAAHPPEGGSHALIEFQNNPIGYIRWQLVSRATLDSVGLPQIPSNSADVDILIGEQSHTSQGIGPIVLTKLISRLRAQGDVPLVGLTTSKENKYAHKAFLKSGFTIVAEYCPDGFGRCFLFVLKLE